MVCEVTVVADIDPCVKAGVICWAAALAGSNSRSSRLALDLCNSTYMLFNADV